MRHFDFTLILTTLALAVIGIIIVYSATYPSSQLQLYQKQSMFLVVGVIAMAAAMLIPLKIHYLLSYYYYGIACLVLFILLFQPGDVDRWLNLGFIKFQPSEIAKLALIFILARFAVDRKKDLNSVKFLAVCVALTVFPFILVVKQPDLGTGLVFVVITFFVLFVAGVKPLYLFIVASPILSLLFAFHWIAWAVYFGILVAVLLLSKPQIRVTVITTVINLLVGIFTPVIWNRLHEYQQERILVFLDPGRDPFGAGYQLIQSKIALGSGGLFGKGFLSGTQTKFAFLPAKATDFIFATLGEQFGLLGELLVLSLFLLLLYRITKITIECRNPFGKLVCTGVMAIIFTQTFVNVGVTAGIMPVTGLPLPFISYGGTSLVVFISMIGLALNIFYHRLEY
ncbi:rod shape-determining protein RodA [bacterium]|nr:rod shape-determining protein RodA [bacterium]